jgi:SOS-response transcriptional repressor LexA
MKTQAERIQFLLIDRGVATREQRRNLARITDVTYEGVRQWFTKNLDSISADHLAKIAKAYDCRLEWLVTGQGEMNKGADYTNGRETNPSVRSIPVLSYVEAGNPKQVIDDYHAGAGMSEVTVGAELDHDLGADAFALIVSGNSMAPEYRDGDLVVVDPSVKPWPGDIVVAVIEAEQRSTIKKYRSRGNDESGHHVFELVPINEDYHTITVSSQNPGHIVGTVVEHRRNLRRRR